jgi:hypothetical protein
VQITFANYHVCAMEVVRQPIIDYNSLTILFFTCAGVLGDAMTTGCPSNVVFQRQLVDNETIPILSSFFFFPLYLCASSYLHSLCPSLETIVLCSASNALNNGYYDATSFSVSVFHNGTQWASVTPNLGHCLHPVQRPRRPHQAVRVCVWSMCVGV